MPIIASLKIAAASGSCDIQSKSGSPMATSQAGLPASSEVRIAPKARHMPSLPSIWTAARVLAGWSLRKVRLMSVCENRRPSCSLNTSWAASSRSTRYSVSGWVAVAAASSSTGRGPASRWSATASSAASHTARAGTMAAAISKMRTLGGSAGAAGWVMAAENSRAVFGPRVTRRSRSEKALRYSQMRSA